MFSKPEEYLYLHFLSEWERTAPPDGKWGRLDDRDEQNTQTARMAKVLRMVTGLHSEPLGRLEKHTKRRDGRSYISRDASWMGEPCQLGKGWYYEGRMSLVDKKRRIVDAFPQMGLSSLEFAHCVQDFVEGKSVRRYWPSSEAALRYVEKWKKERGDDCPPETMERILKLLGLADPKAKPASNPA